ncbi:MAG: DUF1223 domain-containing protein [Hyphomicrobiaceae bacterium]|nr:DUF1223 domain-containing protein [Hyphomicrobiaceae bacterium]
MRAGRLGILLLLAIALGLGPAQANEPTQPAPAKALTIKAVLELFTSQGCSSCPRADALLKTYVDRPDVIALTMAVDIWDYLGWKDTLANPFNTRRQRDYARVGHSQVYTPQLVVNGMRHVVGSDAKAIEKAIAETNRELAASRVDLSIRAAGDKLILAIGKAQPGAPHMEATVWIASVERSVTVEIKRGENRGRSVTYYNVVRRLSPIGMWDGKAMTVKLASRDIMRTANERCIVLLQKGESGPILAAAELKP